jgi:PHD/YefM family antitoxin component YafN of YafNO toxin-antitoxin module
MILTLSDQQREAIEQGSSPLYVTNPQNQARYVLLPAEEYERIRALLDEDDFDIRETYALQEKVARAEGWDDPELDVYNIYRRDHKSPFGREVREPADNTARRCPSNRRSA